MSLFPRALLSLLLVIPLGLAAGQTTGGGATAKVGSVSGQQAPTCSDVLLIGIEGAAEVKRGSTGFGPVMRTALDRYVAAADAGGRSVKVQRMGTRFKATRALLTSPRSTVPSRRAVTRERLRAWVTKPFRAIVTNVVKRVNRAVAECPRRQVALAGYSQGAMVAHRALLRLGSSKAFPMVVGAVLVGDGDRVRKTSARLFGKPVASRKTRGQQPHVTGKPAPDVPVRGSAKRVISVCTAGDLVCDVGRTRTNRAFAIHKGYSTGRAAGAVRRAANQLWSYTRAWPKLPAREPVVPVDVGRKFSRQLAVDVAPGRAGTLLWENVKGLPPGVTLNSKGRLAGTPTRIGNWRISYTVRNTSPHTPPVAGAITVAASSSESVLTAAGMTSCQVRPNHTTWCWGQNTYGQVGDGTKKRRMVRKRVGADFDWESVSTGGNSTCAIKLNGSLWCWGLNNKGQLGLGDHRREQLTPARVGTATDWDQISVSYFHTCGIRDNGTAWCWGNNNRGQLGQNNRTLRIKPFRVGRRSDWATISTAGWHTCATVKNGSAWCWGAAGYGQIGDGTVKRNRLIPRRVSGNQSWLRVSTSWSASCGLTDNGDVWCWGLNNKGQLGTGGHADSSVPVKVKGPAKVKTLTMGNAHTCGMEVSGDMWCWGSNRYGQFGNGTNRSRVNPIRVMRGSPWLAVSAGLLHTCAVAPNRAVSCWGNNEQGQLKRGDLEDSNSPPKSGDTLTIPTARKNGAVTKVTSFNILGSGHTRPFADASNYASGRIRAEWAADLIEEYGSSIVGFQEINADQFRAIMKIMGPRYRAYPGLKRGARAIWTNMIWDPKVWALNSAETYKIPFLKAQRPQPIVRLVNKATGKRVAVLNVHNVSRNDPERRRQRAAELRIEIAQVKRMRRAGWEVILGGDMNDRRTTFCRITRETDLSAVQGGSNRNGKCVMPKQTRLDWVFVSPGLTRGAVNFDMR
ncbi:MAG: cutinase family protein, partial [Nocardioides sp.]|nr:cutinase family protein [Nocardioides sp.]